jgi:branched-chain amino acid transport system substrate-binding protein
MRGKLFLVAFLTGVILAPAGASAQQKTQKVGYIADLSGPMQDNYGPIVEGFEFYVKELNARGGIDGAQVQVVVRDDQLDATRAASIALELATSEAVNSIWDESSRTHSRSIDRGTQPHSRNRHVQRDREPRLIRCPAYSAGHVFEGRRGLRKLAAKMLNGKGKAICNSIEAPGGVAACQYAEGAAQAGGLQTGTVLFPPTVTEFGAIAQRMMGMEPTIVIAHAGSGQNVGLIKALRGAGFNGPILMGSHGLNEAPLINALQGVGGLDKLQIVSRFASPDSPGKELDAIRAAAQKYGKTTPVSTTTIMGWALGTLMEASLRQCGYPCSGDKLNSVLENIKVEMGSLRDRSVRAKGPYGTTWWRVYQYEANGRDSQAVSDWQEASSTPTLRNRTGSRAPAQRIWTSGAASLQYLPERVEVGKRSEPGGGPAAAAMISKAGKGQYPHDSICRRRKAGQSVDPFQGEYDGGIRSDRCRELEHLRSARNGDRARLSHEPRPQHRRRRDRGLHRLSGGARDRARLALSGRCLFGHGVRRRARVCHSLARDPTRHGRAALVGLMLTVG